MTTSVTSPSPPSPSSPITPIPPHLPFSELPVRLTRKRSKKPSRSGSYSKSKTPIQSKSPDRSPVQTRSPIRTRSCSNENQHGPIKLLKGISAGGAAGAASDKIVQKRFMEMIGWVERGIDINHDEEIITREVASIIACANAHRFIHSLQIYGDGYYTVEEMENTISGLLENTTIPGPCGCIAHQNVETFGNKYMQTYLYELMRVPANMNNDHGKKFIIALVSIILSFANLHEKYRVSATEQGTDYTVNFVLCDTVTSEKQSFRDWPDFCITEQTLGAGTLLVSIGEMESKGDCLSQVGIYAVGQFNLQQNIKKKLACIAVYKDKKANVALCSINDEEIISFKIVDSVEHINLLESEGIMKFSRLLIGTLKYVAE